MGSRNPQRAAQAIDELEKETGRRAEFLQLDLASLKSVKAAAIDFKNRESKLNVLFNSGCALSERACVPSSC